MTELGMGALLGVSQGSVREPRMLAMRWKGKAGAQPTAFVGKGVTFDTGGISIKPAAGMEDMKWDMGGAAAVAGTMLTLARRKAKADVIGVCGPGGKHARWQCPAPGRRRYLDVGPDHRSDQHRRRRAPGAVRCADLGAEGV